MNRGYTYRKADAPRRRRTHRLVLNFVRLRGADRVAHRTYNLNTTLCRRLINMDRAYWEGYEWGGERCPRCEALDSAEAPDGEV